MVTPRNKSLILNWIFLPCLLLLALNDHFLKDHYSNWLTGKLSDFTGLLIFPMFLAFLFPRQTKAMTLITGLFFIFWKSPWSSPFITLYNKFSPISITRTIDYSDLLALAVLPLSFHFIRTIDRFSITNHSNLRLQPLWLILPCSFVFMATSPPAAWKLAHNPPEGNIHIGTSYKVKLSPQQILDMMRKEGFNPRQDTADHYMPNYKYVIENVTFPGITDTLQSVYFTLYEEKDKKTYIYVDHVTKKGNFYISDWQLLKLYSKYYDRLLKRHMVREFR